MVNQTYKQMGHVTHFLPLTCELDTLSLTPHTSLFSCYPFPSPRCVMALSGCGRRSAEWNANLFGFSQKDSLVLVMHGCDCWGKVMRNAASVNGGAVVPFRRRDGDMQCSPQVMNSSKIFFLLFYLFFFKSTQALHRESETSEARSKFLALPTWDKRDTAQVMLRMRWCLFFSFLSSAWQGGWESAGKTGSYLRKKMIVSFNSANSRWRASHFNWTRDMNHMMTTPYSGSAHHDDGVQLSHIMQVDWKIIPCSSLFIHGILMLISTSNTHEKCIVSVIPTWGNQKACFICAENKRKEQSSFASLMCTKAFLGGWRVERFCICISMHFSVFRGERMGSRGSAVNVFLSIGMRIRLVIVGVRSQFRTRMRGLYIAVFRV